MPALDVSDITLDPDFAEALTLYRREQVISSKGRVTPTLVLVTPTPYGVVLAQDDLPLQRGPDQQNLPQLLEVHTPFRIRSATKDPATGKIYQPDVLVWNGDNFLCTRTYNFSHFGRGFIRAVFASTDAIDNIPA